MVTIGKAETVGSSVGYDVHLQRTTLSVVISSKITLLSVRRMSSRSKLEGKINFDIGPIYLLYLEAHFSLFFTYIDT